MHKDSRRNDDIMHTSSYCTYLVRSCLGNYVSIILDLYAYISIRGVLLICTQHTYIHDVIRVNR